MKTFRHAVISPALPEEYLDKKTLVLLHASNFRGERQPDGKVLFTSADACMVDELCGHFASLIEHKLQENRADYPAAVALSIAVIGGRGDICGGAAYFVTAFHVKRFSTDEWLAEKEKERESAAGVELFD
ncbi:hypothetical protein EP073_00660 [Geovibrio thiophilus]|uniref:Uncharacterized protein n=1 Tax=Geovibrio thiophilus TaxID=139438 RepID=A0A410JUW6_9BACT|nr:hypothetical protein [Geovibrio thiophilus]QAR31963.1 hypothetical protein EP073_00660 [Geovibrio thiophilus]